MTSLLSVLSSFSAMQTDMSTSCAPDCEASLREDEGAPEVSEKFGSGVRSLSRSSRLRMPPWKHQLTVKEEKACLLKGVHHFSCFRHSSEHEA